MWERVLKVNKGYLRSGKIKGLLKQGKRGGVKIHIPKFVNTSISMPTFSNKTLTTPLKPAYILVDKRGIRPR